MNWKKNLEWNRIIIKVRVSLRTIIVVMINTSNVSFVVDSAYYFEITFGNAMSPEVGKFRYATLQS